MEAKFDSRCSACSGKIKAGQPITFIPGVGHNRGSARHQFIKDCDAAKEEMLAAKLASERSAGHEAIDLKPIRQFLKDAQDRGLKRPKLRVLDADGQSEIALGLTVHGAAPGSLSVVRNGTFIGLVRPDGTPTGTLITSIDLKKRLAAVASDPITAAKEYAALKCRCSFCGLELTDAGSVEVGYGPICAKHWGLPHKPQGTPTLRPVPGVL
jgi:hypothetical protein